MTTPSPFPRAMRLGIFATVGLSLVLAATGRMTHIGAVQATQTPFRLSAWSDGRLTLDDPATARHIELQAFGSTNTEVFAQLLTAHGGTR